MKRQHLLRCSLSLACALLLAPLSGADTTAWNGTGLWDETARWSAGVPQDGWDAVLASGTCLLASSSRDLASLEINGGALLVFSNWETRLTATNIAVNAGKITCAGPFNSYTNAVWPVLDPSNRVAISCSNLTLAGGASIDVSAKGYRGGIYVAANTAPYYLPVATYFDGHGPGGGGRMVGGSHGALGGYGLTTLPKAPYGNAQFPLSPGSGGGCDYYGSPGVSPGHGGGVVDITASGVVTIDGAILADGVGNVGGRHGAGAGGSIRLACARLAGAGAVVSVEGGNTVLTGGGGSQGGSGSGGRISVTYDPALQAASPVPAVTFSARSRWSVYGVYPAQHNGHLGSLWIPDDRLFAFTHSGVWLAAAPAFSSITLDSLTLATSNNWLRIPRDPFSLTVSNALVLANGARLDLSNATLSCGSLLLSNSAVLTLDRSLSSGPSLSIAGACLLTNTSFLALASGPTNTLPFGTEVTAHSLTLGNGSWILPSSHPSNGGSVLFKVGTLAVASNCGFNADARGFSPNAGRGYGPGGGTLRVTSKSGAGYGGRGGDGTTHSTTGGLTYGNSNAPVEAGSAAADNTVNEGGAGGGLIWIEAAGDAKINGTMTANGQNARSSYYAGGSGGGIFLRSRRFGGSGRLSAKGGAGGANATQGGGGGGGGRIAVMRAIDLGTALSTDVAGGATTAAFPGEAGTVAWPAPPPTGSVMIIR